jgi:carbohydrate-selective porin OprB
VLEFTHSLVLARWLAVQSDIQYVINPSGRTGAKNALVIGAQILIQF